MSQSKQKTAQSSGKKKFFQKRIPTLVGLGVLIVALVSGVLLFSQGTGVFAPRATPQSTPKKIRQSNVTDAGFTVSFITDEATTGFIKYGTEPSKLNSQASDDRDQLSGTVKEYTTHHITIRGLEPNTTYYYTLGTGSSGFDNNGQPFQVKTAQRTGVPSAANTIYGSVVSPSGSPAEGAIVYISMEGVGEMSTLVKSSGSWAVSLSNARTTNGDGYAQIEDTDSLTLLVQGETAALTSQVTTTVSNAQPVANITLGESQNLAVQQTTTPTEQETQNAPSGSSSAQLNQDVDQPVKLDNDQATDSARTSGQLSGLIDSDTTSDTSASASGSTVVDLAAAEVASSTPTVQTSQPKITGKAKPNVIVTIEVNSDTQINQQLTADANGDFELDIAAMSEDLEPGEHTVVYSYEDPDTGEMVTKTQTFFVEDNSAGSSSTTDSTTNDSSSDTSNQLAQADTTDGSYPYSSSNPYPVGGEDASSSASPTPSPSPSPSPTASASAVGSRSAQVGTESALMEAGSVSTTFALIGGGLFFILAGVWSWWIANNIEDELAV